MFSSGIQLRFGPKLFISHFMAVLLVSGSIGTFFYFNAIESLMQSLRSRLQNSAALLSQSIDAQELDEVRSEADVEKESYRTTLEKLRRLRRSNPDIAFLFVMRKEGDRVTFVVDSDENPQRLALLHENVRKYGTVFNTIAPGTSLHGELRRAD
jgi:hypothetical protein